MSLFNENFNMITDRCVPCDGELLSFADIFAGKGRRIMADSQDVNNISNILTGIGKDAISEENGVYPEEWDNLERFHAEFGDLCINYLNRRKDKFELYHPETPFLQFPGILPQIGAALEKDRAKYAKKPELAQNEGEAKPDKQEERMFSVNCNRAFYGISDNGAAFMENQRCRDLDDWQKFLLVARMSGSCMSGKEIRDLGGSAKASPSSVLMQPNGFGARGGVMNFRLTGESVLETIWFSLLPMRSLRKRGFTKIGRPLWDNMPLNLDDAEEMGKWAREMRESLLGRLIPASCFCLLGPDPKGNERHPYAHIYRVRGVAHKMLRIDSGDGVKKKYSKDDDVYHPAMAWRETEIGGETVRRPVCPDPECLPWRQIPAMLALKHARDQKNVFCLGVDEALDRLLYRKDVDLPVPGEIGLWCGGMSLTFNSGQASMGGSDRDIQSFYAFSLDALCDSQHENLLKTMKRINGYAIELRASVNRFFGDAYEKPRLSGGNGVKYKAKKERKQAQAAVSAYWTELGRYDSFFLGSGGNDGKLEKLRKIARRIALDIYNGVCVAETAGRLKKWAQCRPRFGGGRMKTKTGADFVNHVIKKIAEGDGAFTGAMKRLYARRFDYNYRPLVDACEKTGEKPNLYSRRWVSSRFFIAAMMCKLKVREDGDESLGSGLAKACGGTSDKGDRRFMSLVGRQSLEDLLMILPHVITLIEDKGIRLCYAELLQDLEWFARGSADSIDIVKRKWAADFYTPEQYRKNRDGKQETVSPAMPQA